MQYKLIENNVEDNVIALLMWVSLYKGHSVKSTNRQKVEVSEFFYILTSE